MLPFPTMDIRQKLLGAAAQVYAETGYRGATTRRIAQAAGVNEVTLFRHFGSKEALIQEALRCSTLDEILPDLPASPSRPEAELTEWATRFADHLARNCSMIRTCMGELEEHPDIGPCATRGPAIAHEMLCEYLHRLRTHGLAARTLDVPAAASMLMGALFCQAISRDFIPRMYPAPQEQTARTFVRLFVRAIAPARGPGRGSGRQAQRGNGASRAARGNGHAPSRKRGGTRAAGATAPGRPPRRPSRST